MKKYYMIVIGLVLITLTSVARADSIDLALGGLASQSSWGGGHESLAIDGNTNGDWYAGSVTHTNYEINAWWQVDLQDTYLINQISIWNRTDGYPWDPSQSVGNRLTDFNVSVLDSNSDTVWQSNYFSDGTYPDPSFSILLPDEISGQFVMVQLNGANYLSLAEVQVYGTSPTAAVPEPSTMLLLGTGMLGLLGLRRRRNA